MKILLDECVPFRLRHRFPEHEAHTVQWAGLKGLKNGELLHAAEAEGYDVLLTVDQGIPYQQNIVSRKIAIVAMRAATNDVDDLLPLVDAVRRTIETIRPGTVVTVQGPVTEQN